MSIILAPLPAFAYFAAYLVALRRASRRATPALLVFTLGALWYVSALFWESQLYSLPVLYILAALAFALVYGSKVSLLFLLMNAANCALIIPYIIGGKGKLTAEKLDLSGPVWEVSLIFLIFLLALALGLLARKKYRNRRKPQSGSNFQ